MIETEILVRLLNKANGQIQIHDVWPSNETSSHGILQGSLGANWAEIQRVLPPAEATKFILQAELDIGQQVVLEKPVAMKPGPNFTRALALRTFKSNTDRYTIFGWVGKEHGDYSISCKDPDLQGGIGQCAFLKFNSILVGGCTTSKPVATRPFNFLKPSPTSS